MEFSQQTRTSLAFCVLGSGSSGNCTALILDCDGRRKLWLIDAGLSPRETMHRLHAVGLSIDDVDRILLTHLDHDHLNPGWPKALQRRGWRVTVDRRHVAAAVRSGVEVKQLDIIESDVVLDGGARVRTCRLPHDDLGSVAFRVEFGGCRLGHATDLGRVGEELLDLFADLDALNLESNYCPVLQRSSSRPESLKRRVMGGLGHLSNYQSIEAVRAIAVRSTLQHVSLLHLSRECNRPERIRALYEREAPHLLERLTITEQRSPTRILPIQPRPQSAVPRPPAPAHLFAHLVTEGDMAMVG